MILNLSLRTRSLRSSDISSKILSVCSKEVCRFWKLLITGKKSCFVSNCYLKVITNDAIPSQYISSNPDCPDFFKTVGGIKKPRTLPTLQNIKLMSNEICRDDSANDLIMQEYGAEIGRASLRTAAVTGSKYQVLCPSDSKGPKSTFFSLSEYARLYILRRDNERARLRARASKNVLNASELDVGVSWDERLQTVVEG